MFEEMSETFSKIKKEAVDSTQKQLDFMKMKSDIKKEESVLEKIYSEMGKYYFENNLLDIPEEYMEYFNTIRKGTTKISEFQESVE